MDTDDLIKALAADTRRPTVALSLVWWGAAGLATVLAAAVFFVTLGPRPDISAAAETPRFPHQIRGHGHAGSKRVRSLARAVAAG